MMPLRSAYARKRSATRRTTSVTVGTGRIPVAVSSTSGASSSDEITCSTAAAASVRKWSFFECAAAPNESRSARSGPNTVSRTYVTKDAWFSLTASAWRNTSTAPLAPPDIGTSV